MKMTTSKETNIPKEKETTWLLIIPTLRHVGARLGGGAGI